MRRVLTMALAAASISAIVSTAAQATVTVSGDSFAIGHFSGQDCPITGPGNPGFSGCWATQTGVFASPGEDRTASRVVAAIGTNGSTSDISTFYPTITGSEFTVSVGTGNILNFLYNMGAGDPVLHYLSIKQADGYELFYDAAGFASGTTYTFAMNSYFPNNPGFSHVTVYDSTGPIPEPAAWALMLLGFGGIGMAMRRQRKSGQILQIA